MTGIVIGFSYPTKFKVGAFLIGWWMNKKYSHTYIRFESSNPKIPSNVYHAAHGMVHFRSFENFKKDNNVVVEYSFSITTDSRVDILAECMSLSGEGYGHIELIKILFSDIVHSLFNKTIKFKNGKGYICSELVGRICEKYFSAKYEKPLFLLKPSHIEEQINGKA